MSYYAPFTSRDRERFLGKVIKSDGCWEWTGAHFQQTGYAMFSVKHLDGSWSPTVAHRVSHELFKGPIGEGLHIDHLCRNVGCVNPAHLEAVTTGENTRRSPLTVTSVNRAKTHCPKGHPYDEANTYRKPSTGKRDCRICMAERDRNRPRQTYVCVICGATFMAEPRKAGRTCSRSCTSRLAWQSRR